MARRGENIYHRKDGRWEGRYWIGTGPDGRRIYKSVYGRRYADVRRELAIQRASLYLTQVEPRDSDVLFEERAAYFLEFKVKPFVKETTLVGYRRLITQHLIPAFGGMALEALEPEDLQRYFSGLNGTLSHGTIGNIFSLLRTILRDAYADGKLTRQIWQNVRLPRESKPPVRVLNREEQTKVEKLAFEQGRFEFILCLYTGIRLGELCALQWEDVDLEGRRLIIRHGMQRISSGGSSRVAMGTPKSASSRREIPLPTFLCAMLAELRRQAGEDARFVIPGKNGKSCDMRTIQTRFQRLTRELGIDGAHIHTLHHTYATRCLENGMGIETLSALLGHSTATVTLRYYAHSTPQQRMKSVQDVPLLSAKPSGVVRQRREGLWDGHSGAFRNGL